MLCCQINFSLQFGEQKFKWFAQVVSNRIKQFLLKQIVYPSGFTYHFTQAGQDWHTQITEQYASMGVAVNQPGTLIVQAQFADNLPEKGSYYLQIKVHKQKAITKSCPQKTASPSWNETLFFDLRKVVLADSMALSLFSLHGGFLS